MGDLLSPQGKHLGIDGVFGWFPDFISIGHINSVSNVWLFDLWRPALVSVGDSLGGWESWMFRCCYHRVASHCRKDRLDAHRDRWPFVFLDKLWWGDRGWLLEEVLLFLSPVLVWWQDSKVCTQLRAWRWWSRAQALTWVGGEISGQAAPTFAAAEKFIICSCLA